MPVNEFSLPKIDQAVQRNTLNEQAIRVQDQAFQQNETEIARNNQDYSDQQRLENTRWVAGATKTLLSLPDQEWGPALEELAGEGFRRGILDPERFDPVLADREAVTDMYNAAMVGLGHEPMNNTDSDLPARIQQAQYYANLDPEGQREYREANSATKAMKTIKVPMSDGSEIMVNYDPETGQGYDLQTGKTMIVRPGQQGGTLVFSDGALMGHGTNVQDAPDVPEGFGTSQSPADRKRAELDTQREFDSLKVAEQTLTMVENAIRLRPMMDQALADANAWNTAWGSLLASIPGSSAMDLKSTITTIKANIGFDRLQRMRAESPTGGALGQVAVQELVALQSTIANLDTAQSTEQFKANMKIAMNQYDSWLRKWGQAVMMEGTLEQKRRYYAMLPSGAEFMHPSGEWRVKR